jgi:hypothetical protein
MPEEKTSLKKRRKTLIDLPSREDRSLLGICIGIAFVFWLLVKLSQTYRSDKTVELSFTLPEGKTFSALPPSDILATIQGTGWDLLFDFLLASRIVLAYDLSNVQDRFVLSRAQLRSEVLSNLSSRGLNIVELNYDDITLLLEQTDVKRVPVRLNSRFSFEQGYQLQQPPSVQPDSVTLTGPESALSDITFWDTDSLVLNNLRTSVVKTTTLAPPLSGIFLSQSEVAVEVKVEQFTEQSFWVPVSIQNTQDSVRIFPQTVQLTCVVGLSRYNTLSAADFEITADVAGVTLHKDQRNTALLQLIRSPDYVSNVRFSPRSVEFFLLK